MNMEACHDFPLLMMGLEVENFYRYCKHLERGSPHFVNAKHILIKRNESNGSNCAEPTSRYRASELIGRSAML